MTTLFEESEQHNPTSPGLELLNEAALKSNDVLEEKASSSSIVTTGGTSSASGENNGAIESQPTVASSSNTENEQRSSQQAQSQASQQSSQSQQPQHSVHQQGHSFQSFTVSDASQIPSGVRVVHIQSADQQNLQAVTTASPVNVAYTVGTNGQIHQVIHPTESTVVADSQERYAYYPSVQQPSESPQPAQSVQTVQTQNGQFYVMMAPQEVGLQSNPPRIIAPRNSGATNITALGDGTFAVEPQDEQMSVEFRKVDPQRSSRDDRRRATHNEVERRRRDKINTWIMKLAAVVPDCQMDQSKQGTSKGGVLSKALDFIVKLRNQNDRMTDTIKEQERILVENQVLRQQVEKLRHENAILQANLQLHTAESMGAQKPIE